MLYHPERLANVHIDLVTLAQAAGEHGDVTVVVGARSIADEQKAIDAGESHLKDPKDSKHVIVPGVRPEALALDLAPWKPDEIDWKDYASFRAFGRQMKDWAANLHIEITWGGDWGWDFDHFELKHA